MHDRLKLDFCARCLVYLTFHVMYVLPRLIASSPPYHIMFLITYVFQALQGHLSLVHAHYANDDEIMQTGEN